MSAPNEVQIEIRLDGKMLWWSRKGQHGIILTNVDGKSQRYFVHVSSIISGPEIPKIGQNVEFMPSERIPRPGFLPVALKVVVYETTPNTAGADALKVGA